MIDQAFEESVPGGDTSFEAAADLSALQYRAVKINSSGQIAQCTVAGEYATGILQDKPDLQGRAGSVRCLGTSKATAGAAVARGAKLTVDNVGRVVTSAASTDFILGEARSSAGAAGEVIAVLLAKLGAVA